MDARLGKNVAENLKKMRVWTLILEENEIHTTLKTNVDDLDTLPPKPRQRRQTITACDVEIASLFGIDTPIVANRSLMDIRGNILWNTTI